tara:strand:+ start:542 stop:865 length:324 start_codon:yes stop_codon:yes gene_type:complete
MSDNYNVTTAIQAINANAVFVCYADNPKSIEWLNDTTPISVSDIVAKQAELKTAYDALAYNRSRKPEYPSWQEQLDLLYKDMLADKGDKTGTWFAAIKAVKDKYPKE